MRRLSTAALIFALALPGCRSAAVHTSAQTMVSDRLFFGRDIPAGGTVSDVDWAQFLATVITPRFPEGLTIWQANGQWRDPRGNIVREPVFIVEIFHQKSDAIDASIAAIAAEYKKRFGQDAVLRAISGSQIIFY
ncbi:MAG TPA: DUF3574 domain-containing protein [Thermoanaerobaculia bacterium]